MRARIGFLVAALVAAGCGQTDSGAPPLQFFDLAMQPLPDLAMEVPIPDMAQPPAKGGIDGVVLDYTQSNIGVVPDARVWIDGFGETRTDGNGHFHFDGVPPGTRLLVQATKETDVNGRLPWSTTEVVTTVRSAETSYIYPRIFEGCIGFVTVDDTMPGTETLDDACGGARPAAWASITWDAGGLQRDDNTTFSGTMRVELMPIPFPAGQNVNQPQLTWYQTLPGDLEAIRLDKSAVTLKSWGAAEFRLIDDATGKPLTISTGKKATVQIEAYKTPPQGPEVVGWAFDPSMGYWNEEMLNGAFKDVTGAQTHHVYEGTVTHLNWFSTDTPVPQGACIAGKLTVMGMPASGIQINATGVTYGGTAVGVTSDDGSFCLNVQPDATLDISAYFQPAPYATYQAAKTQTTGPGSGQCGDPNNPCPDVGTIDMPAALPACSTGRLRRLGNGSNPIHMPVDIFVNLTLTQAEIDIGVNPRAHLGQILPGNDGRFCAQLPSATTYELVEPTGCSANMVLTKPQDTGNCGTDQPNCEDVGEIDFCGGS